MTVLTDQVTALRSKERMIPKISLDNFDERKEEIRRQIIQAAEDSGFFILENQQSPSIAEIEKMFNLR